GGGVVGDEFVGNAVHGGADQRRHGVGAPGNVEQHGAETVIHVRQDAEIAMAGDPARHVAQFLTRAWRIHVKDDRGEWARAVRAGDERWHDAVFRGDADVLFVHAAAPCWSRRVLPRSGDPRNPCVPPRMPLLGPPSSIDPGQCGAVTVLSPWFPGRRHAMTNRRMDEIIRHQHPVTMPATTSVRDACEEMHNRKIGAVLVTDAKGALAGIFTGRDLVRIVTAGKDPGATTLRSAMTKDPH